MYQNIQYDNLPALFNQVVDHIKNNLSLAVREGNLEDYLTRIGYLTINSKQDSLSTRIATRILVIGDSRSSRRNLESIAESSPLNKFNFDYIIDYDDISKFDFNSLMYSIKYIAVLVGPMAHHQKGVDGFSSMIKRMEEETDVYPEVIRITNGRGALHISNNTFREALFELEDKLQLMARM